VTALAPGPVQDALGDVARFVPKLILFLVILVLGVLAARLLCAVVSRLLRRVGFDQAVERGGVGRVLAHTPYDARGLLKTLVYYAVVLFTLQLAFGVWGPNPVSDLIAGIVAWLPRVFIAIVIVVVAAAIAAGVRGLINGVLGGLSYGRLVAGAAGAFIVGIGIIAALDQIGVATSVTTPVLVAVLATIAGILVVGVGGGLVRPMQSRWESWLSRAEQEAPQVREQLRVAAEQRQAEREEAARREAEERAAAEARAAAEREEAARREQEAREAAEAARREAEARAAAERVEAARREAEERIAAEREEAARREREAREAAEAAAARSAEIEREHDAELAREAARQQAAREETARLEALGEETAREDESRAEAARQEVAVREATQTEAAREEAAREEEAVTAETPKVATPKAATPKARTTRAKTARERAEQAAAQRAAAEAGTLPQAPPSDEPTVALSVSMLREIRPDTLSPAEGSGQDAEKTQPIQLPGVPGETPGADAPSAETPGAEAPSGDAPRAESDPERTQVLPPLEPEQPAPPTTPTRRRGRGTSRQ
jgi:hypothetical protein